MGEDAILQIGVATYTLADFQLSVALAVVGAGIVLLLRRRWRLREERIRRAIAQGDLYRARILRVDQPEQTPITPLKALPLVVFLALVGMPTWAMFLENFEAELGKSLGADAESLASLIAMAFAFALVWAWRRARRNFMAPDQFAAKDEEEERDSWLGAFFREPEPGLGAAIGLAVVSIVAIAAILIVGWPG